MTQYSALVEFAVEFGDEASAAVAHAYEHHGAAVHRSDHDNVETTVTVEADSLSAAVEQIVTVAQDAGVGEVLGLEILPTSEWDVREGFRRDSDVDAVSVTEAANILGVTRQRVHQLIAEERIPAARIGHSYAIARSDVTAFVRTKREDFLPF